MQEALRRQLGACKKLQHDSEGLELVKNFKVTVHEFVNFKHDNHRRETGNPKTTVPSGEL